MVVLAATKLGDVEVVTVVNTANLVWVATVSAAMAVTVGLHMHRRREDQIKKSKLIKNTRFIR